MEQHEYLRQVLEAYRSTPGSTGVVRRADRLFATQLYERGVPLQAVENALLLAAAASPAPGGKAVSSAGGPGSGAGGSLKMKVSFGTSYSQ